MAAAHASKALDAFFRSIALPPGFTIDEPVQE